MQKIVFYLYLMVMAFSIFILSNTAFATNWVYVYKSAGPTYIYIDTDSVIKNDRGITFWSKTVLGSPSKVIQTELDKWEVKLTNPWQYRRIEEYDYDNNNKQTDHFIYDNEFETSSNFSGGKSVNLDREISAALPFAKKSNDDGSVPKL
ncbi:MAG TPA: hypothetical protein VJ440_01945 [Candidatus Brocadiaceae bacterium]|nr:hypothetical protein [Candidatus Brocadiaceae bacterium]